VPILPLIDLLILMGTGSLLVGFVLKAISITTRYQPTVLGFSSIDFVIITGVCLGMAVVLAARTWVKANEPRLTAAHHRAALRSLMRSGELPYDEQTDLEPREPEASRADSA
jgi:UDP-N-acetylmuramyl pentapeptide phosphotransferase/UDP-N-acetylglucosamine-1-phosphate transferase